MTDADSDRDRNADESPARVPADDRDPADEGVVGGRLDEGFQFERPPIEPERPDPENALFVVLGVIGTVGLLVSAFAPGLI